jgi:type II secretory ATPase GspE/PulE/Tfp pilus assembly ATPase PilB-like protein
MELLAASPHLLLRHAEEFQKFFGLELHFQLARRSLIERLINSIYLSSQESQYATEEESEQRLRQLAGDAKIVRLVNEMLSQALEQGASDIHVEPEETKTMIRFRVDGILHNYLELPLSDYPAVASRIKLIGNLNIAESRLPQDGRTNFQLGSYDIDIRISTIPVMKGESIVMRLLAKIPCGLIFPSLE